jgi:hypothetical protein
VRTKHVQAFKHAPWRVQLRLTGGSILPIIVLIVIGGMYLAVSARRADIGRQVLDLQAAKAELVRQNRELTANLAELTTPERMIEQALALGFELADPSEIEYVVVEGYQAPPPFVAPKPPTAPDPATWRLSPAYTETLGEWFLSWLGLGGEGRQ